jgi:2-amino-4-hydroxy-6-hydroxymethyldihydropteridine diphosphokinase
MISAAETATKAVYIGLGSNLGDATRNVQQALVLLDKMPLTRLEVHSSLFLTAPVEASGENYVNAVARIQTSLQPEELLRELHHIEREFGRDRPYRNAPRTMDLDILLYGLQQIQSDSLTVPHPRLTKRAFALIPLLQIDPFITIPGAGPAHAFAADVADQEIQRMGT